MGAFFVNYHVRSTDAATVARVAMDLVSNRAYVSPAKDGWVTLYDEASESNGGENANQLARELSDHLGAPVFAFLVHDSGVFVYYLFDRGHLIDEYNSAPHYFGGEVTEEARHRFAGQPPTILQYCPAGTTLLEVESALGWTQSSSEGGFASAVYAEDRLRPFAAAVGIDEVRATLGFTYFEAERTSLEDGKQFTAIQGKKSRPKRGPIPPRIPPR